MTDEVLAMKNEAEHYSYLYNIGQVSREEAYEHIQPYIDAVNKKAKEIAKKYNQKPRLVSFKTFIR